MNPELERAEKLAEQGDLEAARKILVHLCELHPKNATLNYRCACIHDRIGLESDARPYYETAIQLGLKGDDLEGAYIGLGSTYRLLGQFEKSIELLLKGTKLFPDSLAMKVFEAMTLHESGKHNLAVALLLHCIVEKPGDPTVIKYSRAIQQYATEYGSMPSG